MAREFDGIDDKIVYNHIAGFDAIGALAMSMWIYPLTGGGDFSRPICQESLDGLNGFMIFNDTGDETAPCFGFRDGDASAPVEIAPPGTLTASAWQHLYVIFDGSQGTAVDRVRAWRNGSEITLSPIFTNPTTIGTNTGLFSLGQKSTEPYWNGRLAEIGLWLDASTARLAGLASGQAPSFFTSNLHVYLPLLEAGGAEDTMGNAGSPTITGTTAVAHPPGITYPTALPFITSIGAKRI